MIKGVTPEEIAKKIRSYSHGEFNKDIFVDEKKISKRIANNQDIFDRGFNLKKVDIDEDYPEYILKNLSNCNKKNNVLLYLF